MKISVCIITLNEEENLRRCLESVKGFADEILILDSGSSDGTQAIAESYGARWVHQAWLGYVAQKNRLLVLARNEWVFCLDADEEVSPKLYEEIDAVRVAEPPDNVSGYSMPRCVFYEGYWVRHGNWYPDRLTRLFRRSRARFTGGRVHERLEVDGKVLRFKGDLHHYSFRDRQDHLERCQKYARLWAESKYHEGKRAWFFTPLIRGAARWVRGYILKGGFLDRREGLTIANLCAYEVRLKYELLRQIHRENRRQSRRRESSLSS